MISQTQTSPLAVNSSGTGGAAALEVPDWGRKTVFVNFAGGTGTIQVEISPNGTTWYPKSAALTATGFVDITEACTHVRLNTTVGIAGGPPVAVLAGY